MIGKAKPCHHFGDGPIIILVTVAGGPVTILVTPCHHFGDGLAQFYCPPCHHFGDILNNHTPHTNSTKQAGRPVDTKDRTDGLPAWLHHGQASKCGAFAGICEWGETGGSTLPFSLPKKNGEGLAW